MFEGLRVSPFAHLIPACGLWYAQHGALVLHRGSGTITDRDGRPIHSAEGARQGCGFGAFLFCIAYHRALTLTQRAFPDVLILSYVDDCYTFHPTNPLRAHEAMQCLRGHLLSRCKLESVPSKAFVYAPSPTTDLSFVPKEMKGHPDTARLLTFKAVGAYICGTDPTHILAASHAITCDVISKAKNHRLFALLRDTEKHNTTLQCVHTLLRHCSNVAPNFAMRVSRPELTAAATTTHDRAIAMCTRDLIRCPSDWDGELERALKQSTLPIPLGGLGLLSSARQRDAAFTATILSTLGPARRLIPLLQGVLPSTDHRSPTLKSAADAHARLIAARETAAILTARLLARPKLYDRDLGPLDPWAPGHLPPLTSLHYKCFATLLDLPPTLVRRAQSVLQRANHHIDLLAHRHATDPDLRYAANLTDQLSAGAGDWLKSVPSERPTSLSSLHFRTALRRRLGVRIPELADIADTDPFGDELVNQGCTPRHKAALTWLADLAVAAYGSVRVHVETDHAASPKYIPDIAIEGGADDGGLEINDLKIGSFASKNMDDADLVRAATYPFSTIAPSFWRKMLGVVQIGERGQPKYDPTTGYGYAKAITECDYAIPLQNDIAVNPLIHSTSSGRHPHCEKIFKRLCRMTGGEAPRSPEASSSATNKSYNFYSQRVSCAIVRSVAIQIQSAIRPNHTIHRHRRRDPHAPPTPVVENPPPLTPADADRFRANGGRASTAFTSATPLPAAPSDAHRSPSLTQDESLPVAIDAADAPAAPPRGAAPALRASTEIPASLASKGWGRQAARAAATARRARRCHGARRPPDGSLHAASH